MKDNVQGHKIYFFLKTPYLGPFMNGRKRFREIFLFLRKYSIAKLEIHVSVKSTIAWTLNFNLRKPQIFKNYKVLLLISKDTQVYLFLLIVPLKVSERLSKFTLGVGVANDHVFA